jgi:hypothetical protein
MTFDAHGRADAIQLDLFDQVAWRLIEGVAAEHNASPAEGLHVCTTCGSKLVQPLRCDESISDAWLVVLRCPDCHCTRVDVFDDDAIDAFDRELDRGDAERVADLARLDHMNMVDSVNRVVRALDADAIQPIDF